MADLAPGQKAPDFDLPRDRGGSLNLADLRGKKVVVYVYPQADSGICIDESIDFSTLLPEFAEAGTEVVGVAPDGLKKLARFREKRGLTVDLVSDETRGTIEAYGLWVEKLMYGRRFMGVERATFLIDAEGNIARIWRRVRVKGHAAAVLEAARAR